jgi:hypothetical protein
MAYADAGETLNVSVFDAVTVTEDAHPAVTPILVAASDDVTVTEALSGSLSGETELNVEVYEDVVVSEFFNEQPDADVRESVTVTESVTALLTTLLIQQAKHELVAVAEAVTARIGLPREVGDDITVAEAVTSSLWDTERVEAGDDVTVTEDAAAVLNDAATAAPVETVTVTEDLVGQLQETLSVEAGDDVTVAEGLTAIVTPLRVLVFESVAVSEVNSFPIASPTLYDVVRVTESVTLSVPVLAVQVYEAVAVAEGGLNPNGAPDSASYGPTPTVVPANALEDYWVVGLP